MKPGAILPPGWSVSRLPDDTYGVFEDVDLDAPRWRASARTVDEAQGVAFLLAASISDRFGFLDPLIEKTGLVEHAHPEPEPEWEFTLG